MRVDYDKIAHRYDRHRRGGGPYQPLLLSLARECGARRVLEVGAGTGNNTAAFADGCPCEMVALDLSREMIRKGMAKNVPAHWAQADATHIPLSDGSMDFAFGCYMLHYISSLRAMFEECARVVAEGAVAFVTASHEFIENHPMNKYFPSFAEIDKARFQPVTEVCDVLSMAGFSEVGEERLCNPPWAIDAAYVDRIANRVISTYDLIPQEEFEEGLRRLREDVAVRGRLEEELVWEATVIWGRRGNP